MGTESFASYHVFAFFVVTLFLYVTLRRRRIHRLANPRGLPYPPGPTPLPIVGNIFDIARDNETAAYQRLAKQYGDLVFLSSLGKNVLFVNSFQVANELFEKRSANYSDRNESPMVHELMGWDFSFGHMRYGERWKAHRRMFHRQFQQSIARVHWPTQQREAHALLRRLLHTPDKLVYHLRHNAAAVIMGITYGITIAEKEDQYIAIAGKALEGMAKAASPGAFFVDFIPMLKYVPAWVPGASFKRKAHEWRNAVIEMRDAPFATVVNALRVGNAVPSFVTNLLTELETKENAEEERETIRNCAGLAYAAGAESTVSTLTSFILAIVTHPEVQLKAQEELDSVVGRDRLPEFSDRQSLPYTNAILKEVLRWNPVAPLGLPHMVTRDDEYNGYFIPAGTTIVGNSWGILHDPRAYREPSRFNPDRFMGKGEGQHFSPMDPLSASFGYGRRVCPGRYMAEAQVWISIASILSVFNISAPVDEMGNPIQIKPAFSSGMICHPLPFKFSINPRGDRAVHLIEQTEYS
ncbi:cytochrome P450 [Crassisporium funariophilum]|nr:cytochrome P450 [Crassisporium funariophilum]